MQQPKPKGRFRSWTDKCPLAHAALIIQVRIDTDDLHAALNRIHEVLTAVGNDEFAAAGSTDQNHIFAAFEIETIKGCSSQVNGRKVFWAEGAVLCQPVWSAEGFRKANVFFFAAEPILVERAAWVRFENLFELLSRGVEGLFQLISTQPGSSSNERLGLVRFRDLNPIRIVIVKYPNPAGQRLPLFLGLSGSPMISTGIPPTFLIFIAQVGW